MAGNTRITAQQQLGYVPHTSVEGEVWTFIKTGTCTSNGAAGGTTLIDTGADSGAADTYNGRYWVRCTSGANKDQWKRIIDDDGAGTLTLENNGFRAQVVSGVEYEIWQSPEPVIVVDSSGAATTIVDDVRDEANDFWNGYYAVPITGNRRGEVKQITDFVSSSGTFTVSAFSGVLAAGDVVLIRKFVEVGNANDGTTRGYEKRLQNRVNLSEGDGIITQRGGTFSFDTDVTATGSLAGDGVRNAGSVLSGLFQAAGFEETVGTSNTITAVTSTTQVDIATGNWEDYAIGMPVSVNGAMAWVTSLTDGGGAADTVVFTPPLPSTPTTSDVLDAGRLYSKSTDGDVLGCVVEYEVDGERITMTGCKGNVVLNDGPKLSFSWSFNVDHWVREIEAAPYNAGTAYTTAAAIVSSDRIAYLDTTKTDIGGFTASLNTEVQGRMVQGSTGINGRSGYQVTNYAAGATFRELLGSSGELDQDTRFGARTSYAVMVMFGSHGDAFGVRIPAGRVIEDPKTADESGMRSAPNVFGAQDAGSTTDGASSIVKIPDFAFGVM